MTTTPLLQCNKLCVERDGQVLLSELDLVINQGDMLGIIGPNGAGKSTLLKALAGLEKSVGSIKLNNQHVHALSAAKRACSIAWLEQRPVLHWPLNVRQVVALGRLPHRNSHDRNNDEEVINRALAFANIEHLQDRSFLTLSEGEKLLVNLARVLSTEASIILADEPTSALDPRHQVQVMELLRRLSTEGTAVLVVLHDLSLAARYCDRLLLLDKGSAIALGSAEAILTPERLKSVYGINAKYLRESQHVLIEGKVLE